MGSDSVPVLRERRNNNFLDLIEDFCHALADWRANANQISALNEHFGFKFTGDRNGLLTGPSIIAIMLAHRLIEPDNISALIHLADVAGRPDLKDLLNGYTYAPSLVTCQTENLLQNHEDVYAMVAECIQGDWRNLARQLSIAEYEIIHIQSLTEDYQSAASVVLDRFHQSVHDQQIQRLITALKAIGRTSLSRKVSSSLVTNPIHG